MQSPVYRIVRSGAPGQNTGATFYAEGTYNSTTKSYNLVTTKPSGATGDDIMTYIFDQSIVNSGEDNMFNNNVNDATYNDVERVDFMFPSGVYVTDNQNQGFIICERGGNDNFKVAIV